MINYIQAVDHLSEIEGYDNSYQPIFYDSWSDYEEGGWEAILTRDDKLYSISGGYSVMAEGPQDDVWVLDTITLEQGIEIINSWDKLNEGD